jgi:hypothetical protein
MASTLQRVLDLWRASERELEARAPESSDSPALTTQIARLRRLYQTITVHERRNLRGFKGPDRTIVRSEWLTIRSRAAASRAQDALDRARTVRVRTEPAAPEPVEPASNRP